MKMSCIWQWEHLFCNSEVQQYKPMSEQVQFWKTQNKIGFYASFIPSGIHTESTNIFQSFFLLQTEALTYKAMLFLIC
jgi:hypothetical protein